jgi:riboflavin biosynthesis pyrimidine reductase
VAIPSLPRSNSLIAAGSDEDRFVMGLLRACSDCVLLGSGTLRASPRGIWTAEKAYPAAAEELAELGRPALAVLTASGLLDPEHPAFERGAIVLTTDGGARQLEGRLPAASEVVSLGEAPLVDVRLAVEELRRRGCELILSEAGPHVFGSLLEAGLVDELFLTVSPLVAGRREGSTRFSLVEEAELLPDSPLAGELMSVRLGGDHLFARYALS